MSPAPKLIAHRGFAGVHAENTLGAFERAAAVADAVELDVRRCATGDVVVFHDETVDRVTDGSGPVADHTLRELGALDVLGSGEGVPTLRAVLDAVPAEVAVNVELKETGVAADALAVAAGADSEVFVSSFHPEALAAARDAAPAVPRAFLFPASADDPTAPALDAARRLDCEYLHPHHDRCTADLIETARGAGLAVNAWTVTDPAAAERLADRGVDGLIVDDPAVFPGERRRP